MHVYACMDAWMHGCTNARMAGWREGWRDGRTEWWMAKQTNKHTYVCMYVCMHTHYIYTHYIYTLDWNTHKDNTNNNLCTWCLKRPSVAVVAMDKSAWTVTYELPHLSKAKHALASDDRNRHGTDHAWTTLAIYEPIAPLQPSFPGPTHNGLAVTDWTQAPLQSTHLATPKYVVKYHCAARQTL